MKQLVAVLLVAINTFCSAQEVLPFQVADNSTLIGVDPFQNLFFAKGQEIQRYSQLGEMQFRFSQPTLGAPSSICLSNPMAPVLFYQVFNSVVVLDNRLNAIGPPTNLWDLGLADVRSASLADQNRMWVYAQEQDRLLLINLATNQTDAQTLVITQLVGEENTPSQVLSTVGSTYLLINGLGFMQFDAFGAYKKFWRIPGAVTMQIAPPFAAVGTSQGVSVIHLNTGQEHFYPTAEPEHFALNEQFLYLQRASSIVRYTLGE